MFLSSRRSMFHVHTLEDGYFRRVCHFPEDDRATPCRAVSYRIVS